MKDTSISNAIKYIGVDDKSIELFENQYIVPNGMAYNSYIIKDDKIVIMDTVDSRAVEQWLENLTKELGNTKPDYLVISHLEPDHSGGIKLLADKYPEMKIVGNIKTFTFLPQFVEIENIEERKVVVNEGDTLNVGNHTLQFFMAPMVHWPEVMFTYEQTEKILFSADAFGKFGTLDTEEDWACEARRYYFNIVGKYGMQVQAVLKKLASLEVKTICALHGPILKENLEYYINKYDIWSSYKPEDDGVLVAYASIHGNTKEAAEKLGEILKQKGAKKVVLADLVTDDFAETIEDAFRYDKMIVAASSYNFDVFPPMRNFLYQLKSKGYQNRKVGIIENGTWAPSAAKCMREIIDEMKNIEVCEPIVTIKTKMNTSTVSNFENLVENILKGGN